MARIAFFTRALAIALAGLASRPVLAADDGKITMTIATVAPADSPWSAVLARYEKKVEEKTAGKVDVRIKLGGMLGDEIETVTKCRRGQIQAVGASTGAIGQAVPEMNVVELPFLFRNPEEADKIIDDVLTPALEPLFRERGLVLGFWAENGYRHFGTRDGFIKSPADLKGKKMRSQESPVHEAMYKAFGAAATPIPTTEVPQALATGNVDGFDQSALYTIAASWHKSIKYFTVSEHIYQPAAIVFNKGWFDGLPPDIQKVLIDEGRAVQGKGRQAVRQIFPDLLGILASEKVQVYTLTPAERAVFETASRPVYTEFRKSQGKQAVALLDATEKALKELRGVK